MRVLVTGGAGFIGGNLCRALAVHPGIASVVVLDNLSTGRAENLEGVDVELILGDLVDEATVMEAAAGCAAIVHLAARPSVPRSLDDPVASHHANATGTVHVLEAARRQGVSHIVVASSSSVYGANAVLPKSESLKPSPLSPYAASKLATEAYALAFAHSFGLKVLACRFFNVFGPLQPAGHAYAAVVPAFIEAALAGRPLPIFGDGKQSRDFTFVGSVCDVLTKAVARTVHDEEPVNLAFGSRITLLQLADILEAVLGNTLERVHMEPRKSDVRHSQAEQSKLRALFPDAVPVPLDEGLAATVEWFRAGCGPLRPT